MIIIAPASNITDPSHKGSFSPRSYLPTCHLEHQWCHLHSSSTSTPWRDYQARETIGRVAAGAIAEKWLRERYGTEIVAWVSAVGAEELAEGEVNMDTVTRTDVDATVPVRCVAKSAMERFAKVTCDSA